jgi:hypothetical protein
MNPPRSCFVFRNCDVAIDAHHVTFFGVDEFEISIGELEEILDIAKQMQNPPEFKPSPETIDFLSNCFGIKGH